MCYNLHFKMISQRDFWGYTSHKDSGFTFFMQRKLSFPGNAKAQRSREAEVKTMSVINYSLNDGAEEADLSKCFIETAQRNSESWHP